MTFTISEDTGKVVATFTANCQKIYNFITNKYPNHIVYPEPSFGLDMIDDED